MSLYLNGQEIKGSDLKIAATLSLAGEDISGQSSSSAVAETGDKPKTVSVRLQIKFDNHRDLSDLVNLAEKKTKFGERISYTVVNATTKAMHIRQVRFQGDLSVREDESVNLWGVSFKLIEVLSVPERKESRQPTQPVTDQAASGKTVGETVGETDGSTEPELSSFEKILQYADKAIE